MGKYGNGTIALPRVNNLKYIQTCFSARDRDRIKKHKTLRIAIKYNFRNTIKKIYAVTLRNN